MADKDMDENNKTTEEDKKTGKENVEKGFKNFMTKLGDALDDLTSLEVTTFTGNFSIEATTLISDKQNKFKIKNILNQLTTNNNTNLKLVAYTRIEMDADVSTIVKSDLSESDTELLKLHNEMLQSSREARKAAIKMVTNLIPIKK